MSGLSLDDAKDAQQEAYSGNLRENEAGIPEELGVDYDDSEVVEVNLHPEVLLTYDHIARISINQYGSDDDLLDLEQNLQGAEINGQPYGYDLELTVADPQIVTGTTWVDDEDAEYPEVKIAGDPEADTNPYELRESVLKEDGDVVGAEVDGIGNLPGGNNWDGERYTLDADYFTISISGRRAQDVLGALDTAGLYYTTREGAVVEGLFEKPPAFGTDDYDPSESDSYPRLVGYPELRSDMVGQRGAISCTFDVDDSTEAGTRTAIATTVYKVVEGEDGEDLEALTPLQPDDDAYALPTYPRGGKLFWGEADEEVSAAPESEGVVAEAQAMMQGDDTEAVGYDDLTEDEQEFVDDAVGAVINHELDSIRDLEDEANTSHEDFSERVQTAATDMEIEQDADTLAEIVDLRADE